MADSFTVTRAFKAPRERVFATWTIPAAFATWWGTEKVEVPLESVKLDPKVGGDWHATMLIPDPESETGAPREIHWSGTYTEFDPPNRIAFTLTDDPEHPEGAPIVVTFEDGKDGRTHMALTQTSPEFTAEQVQATVAGYADFFDAQARVLGVD